MFTQIFDTRDAVLSQLHFVAKLVSLMTIRGECLIDFERYISELKCSLSYLKLGYINSLTFGFRVCGFDYSTSAAYISDYRKDKGDIVIKLVLTYRSNNKCYFLELVE